MERLEVRVAETTNGPVRHYVVENFELAICGFMTDRLPTPGDVSAHACARCDRYAENLRRRS